MKYIDEWKKAMSGGNLSAADIEELAGHLEDRMSSLLERGFSPEEAWIVAEHELGPRHAIDHEFSKVRPAKSWILENLVSTGLIAFLSVQLLTFATLRLSDGLSWGSYRFLDLSSPLYACVNAVLLVLVMAGSAVKFRVPVSTITRSMPKFMAGLAAGLLFCLVIGFVSASSSDCRNDDPVLSRSGEQTENYRAALASKLVAQGTDQLKFTFEGYRETKDRKMIFVAISGEKLCAKAWLELGEPQTFQWLLRGGGKGFYGAELRDVSLDIRKIAGNTVFTALKMGKVID